MFFLPLSSSRIGCETRVPRFSSLLLGAMCLVAAGCGSAGIAPSGPLSGARLTGVVHGGQQPVTGATISLYAAGTTGYGTGATSLLGSAVTTDSNGSFSITGDYTCPSATSQLYIVSTGGNPGLGGGGTNSSIALMAALGPCSLFGGQLTLDPSRFITINEVTTVASAYALSGFMDPVTTQIGTSSTNAAGLANAFQTVNNLVNPMTGQARTQTLAGNSFVPQSEIYGLADILATCVNSSGGSAQCNTLFSDATPSGGTAPANTLQTILSIATHPTSQASTLSGLISPTAPFQPSSGSSNWLMEVDYGLFSPVEATSIAIDTSGNIWSPYTTGGSNTFFVTVYNNSGVSQPISTTYTGGALSNLFIAFDPAGIPWLAATQAGSSGPNGVVIKLTSNGTVATNFNTPGLTSPTGIAIDGAGNVWVPNHSLIGTSSVFKFGNDGSLLSPLTGYTAPSLTGLTSGVAIDNSGNAWVSGGGGVVTEFSNSGAVLSGANGYTGAGGQLAIDKFGNIWPGKLSPAGVPGTVQPFCGLGIIIPPVCMGTNSNAFALDGAGNAWGPVGVFNGFSREFGFAELNNAGNEVFGPSGYLDQYDPGFLAVDGSGNAWATPVFATSFFQSSTMVELVGASTPIVVPSVGAKNQTVGMRP
jgi:hypothetical protein